MRAPHLIAISFFLAFGLAHCAPGDGGDVGTSGANGVSNSSCTPNMIDSSLALMVQPLGANAYAFQVCGSSLPANTMYTVYGANSRDAVSQNSFNAQAAERSTHISQATTIGATFQVTFLSSDLYFAIYADQVTDTDIVLDDSQKPLMSPHRLPGR